MNSMNTLMCISTFRFLVISNKVICLIKYSNLLKFKLNYFLYHVFTIFLPPFSSSPCYPKLVAWSLWLSWWCCSPGSGASSWPFLLFLAGEPLFLKWMAWAVLLGGQRSVDVYDTYLILLCIKVMKYLISFSTAFQIIQYMTSFCNFWYFIEVLLKIARMCQLFWSLQSCRLIKFKLKVEWQN